MTFPPSFTQGYALCTPRGCVLGHSYRATAQEAIATMVSTEDASLWDAFQADGWTVQLVYARIFIPQYFPSQPEKEEHP